MAADLAAALRLTPRQVLTVLRARHRLVNPPPKRGSKADFLAMFAGVGGVNVERRVSDGR